MKKEPSIGLMFVFFIGFIMLLFALPTMVEKVLPAILPDASIIDDFNNPVSETEPVEVEV